MRPLSLARKLQYEMETLGFAVSAHPLELYDRSGCMEAKEMPKHRGRRITMAGWLIAGKLTYVKKPRPRPMKFLSMEDLTGTFEVTLFPDAYEKFASITLTPGPFRITGRVEDDMGALSLVADHIELLKLLNPAK
ncbi:MAG: hypothetical protein NTX50_16730 [Candidatus Sumerlaeota bacterium]|nr:hypothetical protein [Candidatus Sumerlaeota bacterium]